METETKKTIPHVEKKSFSASPALHVLKVHPAPMLAECEKSQLLHEIELLKDKLRVAHASVSNSKATLLLQKQRRREGVATWRQRVDDCHEKMKKEKTTNDEHLAHITQCLLTFEDQLRKEQQAIVKTMEEKDSRIVTQQRRIDALTTANERLMKAMGRKHRHVSGDQWSLSEDEMAISTSTGRGGNIYTNVSMTTVSSSTMLTGTHPLCGSRARGISSIICSDIPSASRRTAADGGPGAPTFNATSQELLRPDHILQRSRHSTAGIAGLHDLSNIMTKSCPSGSFKTFGGDPWRHSDECTKSTSDSDDSKTSWSKKPTPKKSFRSGGKESNSSKCESVSGGGTRLARRASTSFRNWWSGSDREDDDDKGNSGWYSDCDPTSGGKNAQGHAPSVHAPPGRILPTPYPAAGKTPSKGSSLSKTFKSFLSPNMKTRKSRSPAIAKATLIDSSSEDISYKTS